MCSYCSKDNQIVLWIQNVSCIISNIQTTTSNKTSLNVCYKIMTISLNVYNIKWREEEEHCFRRFHTAKVLMNKFLLIFFYLSYLPLLNFWTRICCQKKYAVFWPPSSFAKKKYLGSYSSRINKNFTKFLILVYIKKVFQFWWQWSRLQEKLVVQFYDIHLKSKINLINL